MSQGAVKALAREEMVAEINLRMGGSEENKRMLVAMEIEKQSNNALFNWLSYLKRTRTGTR